MMATTYRSALLEDDAPPAYSQFPLPEEQSIDAGAGAPIVRVQPSHVVVNPSDPRSQYARRFFQGGHAPLELPRRADVLAGPMTSELLETAPAQARPAQSNGPLLANAGPTLHTSRSDGGLLRAHVPTTVPPARTPPGPVLGNISYSSLRDNPTSIRVVRNTPAQWQQRQYNNNMLSSWPRHDSSSNGGSNFDYGRYQGNILPATYTVTCPSCRNTGRLGSGALCSCPVGTVAQRVRPRPQAPSLVGLLENMITPLVSAPRVAPAVPTPYGVHHPPLAGPREGNLYYLAYVPGPGEPCPNCSGQSYFRNREAQSSPVIRDIERWHGGAPPSCSVCLDRGRI